MHMYMYMYMQSTLVQVQLIASAHDRGHGPILSTLIFDAVKLMSVDVSSSTLGVHCSELRTVKADVTFSRLRMARQTSGLCSVISYNVLAQTLATSKYFPYAPKGALKAVNRLPAIIDEVGKADADVLVLSEAFQELSSALAKSEAYRVMYHARPARQYGSIIAWKSLSWELLGQACAIFNDIAATAINSTAETVDSSSSSTVGSAGHGQGSHVAADVYCTDNIAQFVALRCKASGRILIVCGTHLHWNPAHAAVKTAQAAMCKVCLADFIALHVPTGSTPPGIILAGDLNSMPDSDAYSVIAHAPLPMTDATLSPAESVAQWNVCSAVVVAGAAAGATTVPSTSSARANGAGIATLQRAPSPDWTKRLRQALADQTRAAASAASVPSADHVWLRSAYAEAARAAAAQGATLASTESAASRPLRSFEPPITTATATFKACIDYIFAATGDTFKLEGVSPLPVLADADVCIPSIRFPSDHLMLAARYQMP